jgi:hypothetical protein
MIAGRVATIEAPAAKVAAVAIVDLGEVVVVEVAVDEDHAATDFQLIRKAQSPWLRHGFFMRT